MTSVSPPHPISGVLDLAGDATFEELVVAADKGGWTADGLQPEPADATLAELVARRQPRPLHWWCGLLASRLVGLQAHGVGPVDGLRYRQVAAPRKSSGPDLAYLFIGGQGRFGTLERARIGLLRPAQWYVEARARFDAEGDLFDSLRRLAQLAPDSTRSVDLAGRRLTAFVAARAGDEAAVAGRLDALGFECARVQNVPLESRFRPNDAEPAIHVSTPWGAWRAAFDAVEAEDVATVTHSDAHGFALRIERQSPLEELVEAARALRTTHTFDDVFVAGAPVPTDAPLFRHLAAEVAP